MLILPAVVARKEYPFIELTPPISPLMYAYTFSLSIVKAISIMRE